MVRRKGSEIDWDYVTRWSAEFAGIPGREHLPDAVRKLRTEGLGG